MTTEAPMSLCPFEDKTGNSGTDNPSLTALIAQEEERS
jgi:hypothetical protein